MAIEVRCPNGHMLRVKDACAGKAGLCPQCRAKVRIPMRTRSTENDPLPTDDSVHQDARDQQDGGGSGLIPLVSSYTLKKTKQCPNCDKTVSLSFSICPRCGTPLAPRTIKPLVP